MGQANEYHLVNASGSILIRTTSPPSQNLPEELRQEFSIASSILAAMTVALSRTINPISGHFFSLYNYHGIERILSGSGRFTKVVEDSVTYNAYHSSHQFGRRLFQKLLGVSLDQEGTSVVLAILNSLGKEAMRMSTQAHPGESKVGHMMLILENLAGVASVTIKLFYFDVHLHSKYIQLAPCKKNRWHRSRWDVHVDTYAFNVNR
ncbi:MAG: hypothetical protein JJU34_00980 [Lunatimonas sp.]|uniref:hypothetical protein n=1 Tax=Lunatimonas sp. TaxID=2060141 RepID=UPI00263B927F|nr:hypothetical protein [Lunatimonas sp.]MCC5935829.1 hypothetical protein [Lunatimonas sp.]